METLSYGTCEQAHETLTTTALSPLASPTPGEVFEKYADMVYRLALTRTKNRADAEDVLQEVFFRYIRAKTEYDSEEHRKAWLLRVTLQCAATLMTSAWVRRIVPFEDKFTVEMKEKSDVYYAVLKLPARYRTVIHLFYYEKYKITEIADILKEPESTVKTHLARAREKLRGIIEEGSDEHV